MTNDDQAAYSIAVIRNLLEAAFTPQSLRRFCQDRPAFRPLVKRFGANDGLVDMVERVITYCQTHDPLPCPT